MIYSDLEGFIVIYSGLPSGKLTYPWKDPAFLTGKLTISMAMFNSYLSLPEAHMDWICQVWNLSFSQTAGRQRTTQAVQVEQGLRTDGCTSMRFKVQTIASPKW